MLHTQQKFGYQETSFVSFYKKSAGVLQDVQEFLQDVKKFLQDVQKFLQDVLGISTGCSEIYTG